MLLIICAITKTFLWKIRFVPCFRILFRLLFLSLSLSLFLSLQWLSNCLLISYPRKTYRSYKTSTWIEFKPPTKNCKSNFIRKKNWRAHYRTMHSYQNEFQDIEEKNNLSLHARILYTFLSGFKSSKVNCFFDE